MKKDILTFLVLLVSCNPNPLTLKKIGQQVFETDFVPSSRFSGVFEDKTTGQQLA